MAKYNVSNQLTGPTDVGQALDPASRSHATVKAFNAVHHCYPAMLDDLFVLLGNLLPQPKTHSKLLVTVNATKAELPVALEGATDWHAMHQIIKATADNVLQAAQYALVGASCKYHHQHHRHKQCTPGPFCAQHQHQHQQQHDLFSQPTPAAARKQIKS
ncbi:hypothetical protein BC828DRAFT_401017 [Blastocladiella britannica]|nr:hypothetical protein BC828DRAFT_401017 [Blastocladiella britannica]